MICCQKKENIDSATTPLVQIFPEGGNIISAINSRVAVKITDGHGNPLIVRGILKDNANDGMQNSARIPKGSLNFL